MDSIYIIDWGDRVSVVIPDKAVEKSVKEKTEFSVNFDDLVDEIKRSRGYREKSEK